jgi:cytochrome c oxidase accessory protein FixG
MATSFVPLAEVGVLESPEDVLSTLGRDGKRHWLYPTPSEGRYTRGRRWLGWALIAFFVLLPVVHIGGKPAVFLNIAAREFTFFGFTFYPTDTFLLLLFGISALVSIALLTALLGRVWCGWGCPQTVYLEFVFRPIERLIEGKEHIRKRRDDGAWSVDKAWRKGAKWALYILVSVGLAHVFVSYFVGWANLIHWMTGPPTEHWGYFLMMAVTSGLVLFDFGIFREQMCTITCPYARMQSVLMDQDSMIVSYDPTRGEPRAKRSKKKIADEKAGLLPAQGDCIDCMACVRTCPTGIDIRDGLQMECIACTQCIDACDDIMDKIDLPRGLIRYTSENELGGVRTRVARPRTVIYGALLVLVATIFTIAVTTRDAFDIKIGRSVGAPFMELPDGDITNRLYVRVRNQTATEVTFEVALASPEGGSLKAMGIQPLTLAPQEMKRLDVFAVVPRASFGGSASQAATFTVTFSNGLVEEVPFTLLGPSR